MTKREEIRQELEKINTGFEINGKPAKIDTFSSFLACEKPLKQNSEILEDIESETDPIDAAKPKSLLKRYPDVSFKFPKDFFDKTSEFNNQYMFVGTNVAVRKNREPMDKWWNFRDTKLIGFTYKLYMELNDEQFKGAYITDIIKNVIDSNAGNIKNTFFIGNEKFSFTNTDCTDEQRAQRLQKIFESVENGKTKRAQKKGKVYEQAHLSYEDALENVQNNRNAYEKSAKIFVEECHVIKPKKLVVFGNVTNEILKQMLHTEAFKQDDNVTKLVQDLIEIPHYSLQGKRSQMYHWIKVEAPKAIKEIKDSSFTAGLNW